MTPGSARGGADDIDASDIIGEHRRSWPSTLQEVLQRVPGASKEHDFTTPANLR